VEFVGPPAGSAGRVSRVSDPDQAARRRHLRRPRRRTLGRGRGDVPLAVDSSVSPNTRVPVQVTESAAEAWET